MKEVSEVVAAFKNKDFLNIILKIVDSFMKIKGEIEKCLFDKSEPILKGGCRYEEQFKNCQKYSKVNSK